MPLLGVYSWLQITTPGALSASNLRNDTSANDPSQPDYDPGAPSWTDKTYTYNGGTPTHIKINDDDGLFEDNDAETGAVATLAEDVTIDGVTYYAGETVENEFALVDGGGSRVYVIRIGGQNVGFAPQTPYYVVPAGVTFYPTESLGGTTDESSIGTLNTVSYSGVICFAAETLIDTPQGSRPAGELMAGDEVLTLDRGPQPLLWVGATERRFDGFEDPSRPVLLPAGALGEGLPARDLRLSPQHRVLVSGRRIERLCKAPEALVPARGLLPLPGVRQMRGIAEIRYVHLLLDHHAILSAEGLACESLLPGPVALRMMEEGDRRAMLARLPQGQPIAPARPLLNVRDSSTIVRARRGEERQERSPGFKAVGFAPSLIGIAAQ